MDLTHNVMINTSAAAVFRTLSTQEGISGWYTPATKAEPKVGTIVECMFANYGVLKFRVDTLEPNRRVIWTVVQGPTEWMNTTLTFTFAEATGKVDFDFRHAGLPEHYDAFSSFNYLWGQYVRSIKLYAETGVGEPFGSSGSKAGGTTPGA